MEQKQTQQTQLTFFLPDRRVLGWVWIAKRVMGVITLGSISERYLFLAMVVVGLRELLGAFTDYAQAKNPVITTNQSSPPNPKPDVESGP